MWAGRVDVALGDLRSAEAADSLHHLALTAEAFGRFATNSDPVVTGVTRLTTVQRLAEACGGVDAPLRRYRVLFGPEAFDAAGCDGFGAPR
ncbi:hypothetical protein M885DRAFT_564244 [Pelagophyceae sp. CCMP2097]|nr:hypothetical protein M885DRAFT_564244 [Pelagophyceae sp. CCMP2097]